MKGWLDNYGKEENYNDSKTSAPKGFKGDGYSNVGRNYSPAWGGQFQKGGKLKFLQPTDKNLPEGYRIPYDTPSSERAMSIGGEDGEPAYLIPSFKYGKELDDPMEEFRKTGEHLGGPFKTWQEADEWERTVRHPAVEKGENIIFPQQEFRTGGEIPKAQEGINNIFGNMMGGKNTSQYEMYGDDLAKDREINTFNPHYTRIDKKEPAPTTELPSKDKVEPYKNNASNNIGFTYQYPVPATSSNRRLPVGSFPTLRKRKKYIYEIGDIYNITPEDIEPEEEEEPKPEFTDPISWIIEKITNLFTPSDKTESETESETDTEAEGGEKGSWNIQQKNTRMKGGGGSYDALNIDTNNPKTIREAKRKADIFNSSIQKKYGKSKNPKAIERLNTIRNDVQITPNIPTPNLAMGGSIPGAVGFTYARTKGIPSNGPYAKKTLASAQDGEQLDMHGNPMFARRVDNPNINRSYYDPRLNTMNIGTDYTTWRDDEGNQLTGDDLKLHQDQLLAHENYHAIQHSEGRDNYDIAHDTDDRLWAEMQNPPQMMTTDAVWNNFYNRSDLENQEDYIQLINDVPEARILNKYLLFDKVLDSQRYTNPLNLEGEAKYYEEVGKEYDYKNGGSMSYYQHGLDWKPKGMKNGGWLDSFAEGGIIRDNRGQWAHPGEITEIGSNNITMQGVPYDVLGISDKGDIKLMKPGKNYKFKGKKVTEFPMAKNGVNQQDQKTFEQLDQLTNFTNYNKPQPGGWLNKYN
jgi:hypothetical protein